MERTLTFTLTLEKDGAADITILEGESGDVVSYPFSFVGYAYNTDEWKDIASHISDEIYGWLEIMRDNMEDEE